MVGSNEDWYNPDFNARFFPSENGEYGRVIFEYNWSLPWNTSWKTPIFGLNDQGLFFDYFATPYLKIKNGGKIPFFIKDHYRFSISSYALSVCSTIQEVVDLFSKYNLKIGGL